MIGDQCSSTCSQLFESLSHLLIQRYLKTLLSYSHPLSTNLTKLSLGLIKLLRLNTKLGRERLTKHSMQFARLSRHSMSTSSSRLNMSMVRGQTLGLKASYVPWLQIRSVVQRSTAEIDRLFCNSGCLQMTLFFKNYTITNFGRRI